MKKCKKCQKESEERNFRALRNVCKKCENERIRLRLQNQIELRLKHNIVNMIKMDLAGKEKEHMPMQFFNALPYDMEQLKEHLSEQFDETMNFENYGKVWSIDHVIARNGLPYQNPNDETFLLCYGLNNLRPIRVLDNSHKSNKGYLFFELKDGLREVHNLILKNHRKGAIERISNLYKMIGFGEIK